MPEFYYRNARFPLPDDKDMVLDGVAIGRATDIRTATIVSGAALSDAIDMRIFVGGHIFIPAEWTAANIGFKVCATADGTFVILCDASGDPVEISGVQTAEARAYPLPDETFSSAYMKVWSKNTASATDVNQAATRTIGLVLKG